MIGAVTGSGSGYAVFHVAQVEASGSIDERTGEYLMPKA
jgi:hypothetical protein